MIHVVLVEPEIPQNTGNIARTCACTGASLHLVGRLGFEISEKTVKRAGLDYWDKVNIFYHDSLEALQKANPNAEFFYLSTKAKKIYSEINYPDNSFIVFGKETKGLNENLIFSNPNNALRIPMNENVRSLNLANSVAVVLYEALRQHNFFGEK